MKLKKRLRRQRLLLAAGLAAVALLGLACFFLLREPAPDFASDGLLRVCIDAGHGGDDPGATDRGKERFEKDDCLSMALAVQAVLAEKYPQIEVLLTRSDDTYPTLEQRTILANDFCADLFLSIHRNSSESNAQGVEIWIPSNKPSADQSLAQSILDRLKKVGISDDRGVKNGTANNPSTNYYVLGHTDMPGCLIELGFITSDEDNRLLDLHQAEYAAAIAEAVAERLLAA